jgi:hypothetical protein
VRIDPNDYVDLMQHASNGVASKYHLDPDELLGEAFLAFKAAARKYNWWNSNGQDFRKWAKVEVYRALCRKAMQEQGLRRVAHDTGERGPSGRKVYQIRWAPASTQLSDDWEQADGEMTPDEHAMVSELTDAERRSIQWSGTDGHSWYWAWTPEPKQRAARRGQRRSRAGVPVDWYMPLFIHVPLAWWSRVLAT